MKYLHNSSNLEPEERLDCCFFFCVCFTGCAMARGGDTTMVEEAWEAWEVWEAWLDTDMVGDTQRARGGDMERARWYTGTGIATGAGAGAAYMARALPWCGCGCGWGMAYCCGGAARRVWYTCC